MKNVLIAVLGIALAASLLFPRQTGMPQTAMPVAQEAAPPSPAPQDPIPPPSPPPAPPPAAPDRYEAFSLAIRKAAETPGLKGSALGFCLIDGAGKVVVNMNAETAFIPASTLKTVTTATALQRLGPDFRFTTRLRSTAPLRDGVLDGDIVIAGEADPLLSLADLAQWAEKLKADGLKEVSGRIIGDGRFIRNSLWNDYWNWGDIGNGYGSAVGGLNLEHNRYSVTFHGGETPGGAATMAELVPEVPSVKIENLVTTGEVDSRDNVVFHGGERTGILTFRGTVPPATDSLIVGAVPDPEAFAAWHFRAALLQAGITVKGESCSMHSLAGHEPEAGTELLQHPSPPLLDLITSIHATSDNHETECLYRRMGELAGQAPDALIREHWKAQGLAFTALRMEDGCGLARADHIRPLDLARLQFLAAQGPHGAAYQASLLSDGPVRCKGGAMSSIRSSTGYITSSQGGVFCFALMVNHYADSLSVSQLRRTLLDLAAHLE